MILPGIPTSVLVKVGSDVDIRILVVVSFDPLLVLVVVVLPGDRHKFLETSGQVRPEPTYPGTMGTVTSRNLL